MESVDRGLLAMSRSFRRSSGRTVRSIVIPSVVPFLFASGRVSFANSWKLAALAETFGGYLGIGYQLEKAFQTFSVVTLLAWMFFFVAVRDPGRAAPDRAGRAEGVRVARPRGREGACVVSDATATVRGRRPTDIPASLLAPPEQSLVVVAHDRTERRGTRRGSSFLVVWQWAGTTFEDIPAPTGTIEFLIEEFQRGEVFPNVAISLVRAVIGSDARARARRRDRDRDGAVVAGAVLPDRPDPRGHHAARLHLGAARRDVVGVQQHRTDHRLRRVGHPPARGQHVPGRDRHAGEAARDVGRVSRGPSAGSSDGS